MKDRVREAELARAKNATPTRFFNAHLENCTGKEKESERSASLGRRSDSDLGGERIERILAGETA